MTLPPLPRLDGPPAHNLDKGYDEAIEAYLGVTDDGELARLAAIAAPKDEVFDARSLVDRAVALQAQVAEELVRRREVIANSMDYATLLRLAGQLGIYDVDYLNIMAKEMIPDDPVKGPVLRRLSDLIWAMPPPKDFPNDFLFEDFSTALKLAASRTQLPRPVPHAPLEEILRYAANIPSEEVSWDILNGAFMDFLRIWYQDLSLPPELFATAKETEAAPGVAELYQLFIEHVQHEEEVESFHKSFMPGQDFPADIVEGAYRAYVECWESGILPPRRFAWLVVEFSPFWRKHGAAYRAIHASEMKEAAKVEAIHQKAADEKSAKAKAAGEAGLNKREGDKWRSVTASFIRSLEGESTPIGSEKLQLSATHFAHSITSLGLKLDKAKVLEFLGTLCTAVTSKKDAKFVLEALKRSKLTQIEGFESEDRVKMFKKLTPTQLGEYKKKNTIPSNWIQFRSLTEDAVSDCLKELEDGLARLEGKKVKKQT